MRILEKKKQIMNSRSCCIYIIRTLMAFCLLFTVSNVVYAFQRKNIDTMGISFMLENKHKKAVVYKINEKKCEISVPQYIMDKKNVTYEIFKLAPNASYDVRDIVKIVRLPISIIGVAPAAFQHCEKLECIYLPDSISYIQMVAFRNCTSLREVNVKSVNYVGELAFVECKSLVNLSFLGSVKKIEKGAFLGCKSIKSFDMPDCLSEVGEYAFRNCSGLESIKFSKSLREILPATFAGCTSLTEIYLPDNILKVYIWAFVGCCNLKKVIVSRNTQIDELAFPEETLIEYY